MVRESYVDQAPLIIVGLRHFANPGKKRRLRKFVCASGSRCRKS